MRGIPIPRRLCWLNNMLKILDGRIIRDEIMARLKKTVAAMGLRPTLAIVQVGDLEESNKYIKQKKIFGDKVCVEVRHIKFPTRVTKEELVLGIEKLNTDQKITGIILQLPIPIHLNAYEIIELIKPEKDVDGLTNNSPFTPATAKGVMTMFDYYKIDVLGKKMTVMGRSRLVGGPIAKVLAERGALVSVVHSQTENPKEITKSADILVVAIGQPNLIDESYLKAGQIVIDVGINFENMGLKEEIDVLDKKMKLVGDVDFDKVKDIVRAITPVPGGVGPLTVASLFENLVKAAKDMV